MKGKKMSDSENEIKEKVQVVLEKTGEIGKSVAGKANELYNRLPLDKINEKLGGKVDVRNKKVMYTVFIALFVLVVIILSLIFGGCGDGLSAKEMARANELASLHFDIPNGLEKVKYVGKSESSGFTIREFEAVGVNENGETMQFNIIVPTGTGFNEQAIEVTRK